jgi:hypothetical protein
MTDMMLHSLLLMLLPLMLLPLLLAAAVDLRVLPRLHQCK